MATMKKQRTNGTISGSKMALKKGQKMQEGLNVYWNGEGYVLLELEGSALELSRAEAEQLFVDLGHVLQDMDMDHYNNEGLQEDQPDG